LTTDTTLILGGARSGKSDYAEKLAAQLAGPVLYIATAQAGDDEMSARIVAHRQARPAHWHTLEAPRNLAVALTAVAEPPRVMLLDCMTLLVSNILLAMENEPQRDMEQAVYAEIDALLTARQQFGAALITVSNEVGLGLVPSYALGRLYRDVLGRANQYLAARADRVLFMVAGLPLAVKEPSSSHTALP
jgi:adenosylcobinamide kinase/adenosylcobinamide-phosphate guanylyltransferase